MINILVTNDDGISAAGIEALVRELSDAADVYVFAPAEQQSGKSHSITYLRPVEVTECKFEGARKAYVVNGTPADCVKIGLVVLRDMSVTPDFVISGINLGLNSGLAAYYSGTVAAAREGAINGIRSIALSQGHRSAGDFGYILGMLPMLFGMSDAIDSDVLLSVNVPDIPEEEIKGYKIVEAAPYGYGIDFVFTEESDGVYQMDGAPARTLDGINYDFDANKAGYAAISPIPTTLSDPGSLARLMGAADFD